MTADVTVNSALQQQAGTANSTSQLAGDFDQFLQLLTVQLQNQDPLNPTDTAEFTNQLVAFSGVEQQINTNQRLDSLVSLQVSNTFSSALGYVGLEASYISSETFFDGTNDVRINYAIEGDARDTTINIFDESGDLVFTQNVSDDEGVEEFIWNGQTTGGQALDAGTYTIRLDALDAQNNPLSTSTVVSGRIRGVETQNGSIFALVGERAVSVGQLINVSDPGFGRTTNEETNTDTDTPAVDAPEGDTPEEDTSEPDGGR